MALEALGEVDEFSLVELLDEMLVLVALVETLLEGLEEEAVELLDVLLVEGLLVLPLEGLYEFLGGDVGAPQF